LPSPPTLPATCPRNRHQTVRKGRQIEKGDASTTDGAALVTIAKLGNQPRCPSPDEQINKMYTTCNNEVLLSHKEEQNYIICRKIDGTRDHHVKQNKPDSERQILLSYAKSNLKKKRT
jgi:hypothetical protein